MCMGVWVWEGKGQRRENTSNSMKTIAGLSNSKTDTPTRKKKRHAQITQQAHPTYSMHISAFLTRPSPILWISHTPRLSLLQLMKGEMCREEAPVARASRALLSGQECKMDEQCFFSFLSLSLSVPPPF